MKCLLTACKPISWIHERTIMLQPHWILKVFFTIIYYYIFIFQLSVVNGITGGACLYVWIHACMHECMHV